MQISPFTGFKAFGSVAGKFLEQPAKYARLVSYLPDWQGLIQASRDREKRPNHNALLKEVFTEQLQSFFAKYSKVKENVEAFSSPSTLTITTGHQLVLAGGPAYLYYKIASVIALSRQLSVLTGNKVVPVFWLASEDHDIEEIKEGNIKGKSYRWDGNWEGYSGVVPTNLLQDWKSRLILELQQSGAPSYLTERIEKAYAPDSNLAEATTRFIMDVFGDSGLLVLNPDHPQLKSLFATGMQQELEHQSSMKSMLPVLEEWPEIWENPKLEPQVKPREINLFFLHEKKRLRIIRHEENYFSAGDLTLGNLSEVLNTLHTAPEKFSPNVVLRPLYQETILPNVAYVGGPGEIHYWLELKPVFDAFGVFYPVLLPRLSLVVLMEKHLEKWQNLGLALSDFKEDLSLIQKKQLEKMGDDPVDWEQIIGRMENEYHELRSKVGIIDPTLQPGVMAEMSKTLQGLQNVKGKLTKALKVKNETVLRQSEKIYAEVFPENTPQERIETGLGLEWQVGPGFIEKIVSGDVMPGDVNSYLLSY